MGVGDVRIVARTQEKTDRLTGFIDHGMELGVHPALGAPEGLPVLAAGRIARAAMNLDVGGIKETPPAFESGFHDGEDLRPHPTARPIPGVMIDAVPARLLAINRAPFTALAQDGKDAAQHRFQRQRRPPSAPSSLPFSTPPGTLAFRCLWPL